MNRGITTKNYVVLAILFAFALTTNPLYAQLGDIGAFLKAGADDATILTREYVKPIPTGFGTGLNAGWAETATPKKTLAFSIQIRSSIALVPSSDQEFDISELNLDRIQVAAGENPITPTIAGDDSPGPKLEIKDDDGNVISNFTMPEGLGVSLVPAPIVQANLGLIKNTDVTLRFFPETKISDFGKFSVFGGAIRHELTQWLPGNKIVPVDISVMIGFNRVNLDANLDVQPDPTSVPYDPANPGNFDDQKLTTSTNTFVISAIAGKTISILSVYGGLGYQTATMDLDVKGDYPVETSYNVYEVLSDPISLSMDSDSDMFLMGGFRVKLGFLRLYAEATVANYFTANAGIGFGFR